MFACLWVFFCVCNFVLFVFAVGRVAWNKPVMMMMITAQDRRMVTMDHPQEVDNNTGGVQETHGHTYTRTNKSRNAEWY